MASGSAPLDTTEGDTRYLRWFLLLDKCGTMVLRHVFDSQVPPATLATHLNSKSAHLHGLKSRKVIKDDQWNLLYPPSGRPPDSATFDITLLTCLLRNICSLNQTSPAWSGIILSTDVSVEADICRLRGKRNEAIHLAPKSLTEQEYNTKETDLEQVLLRLGASVPDLQRDINTLKTRSIDSDCERSLLAAVQEWHDLGTTLIASSKETNDGIAVVKEDISDIKTKLEDLPDNIRDVKEDISDIKSKIKGLPGNISVVKDNVSDIKSKVEDLPGNISVVKEYVSDIKSKVDDIPGNISVVKEDVSDIKSKVEDLPGNISVVKEDVSDIKSKLQKAFGETGGVTRNEFAGEEQMKIEDIRRKLIDHYEAKEQTITVVFIALEHMHIPIKDIYVPLTLTIKQNSNKPTHSNNSVEYVKTLRDVFFTDNKKCKHVVISGNAGYGKSVYCKHLVHLWCSAHSKASTQSLTADEEVMAEFPLLFYVYLEDTTFAKSKETPDEIANIIFEQLQLSELGLTHNDLRSFLQSEGQVLVLLDAFDECNEERLPRGGMYNKCTIATTSRPWKLELLRADPKVQIDKEIEIMGLHVKSSYQLSYNLLQILKDDKKSGRAFIEKVINEGLELFLEVPVLTPPLFSLWFDEKPFGRSETEIYRNIIHHQILAAMKMKHLPEPINTRECLFPICQASNCQCMKYKELLWNVSEFAFNTLRYSGKRKEVTHVQSTSTQNKLRVVMHEQNEFPELSTHDVDICLKLGILTQYKHTGKISDPKLKTVGFLHRTYLEWFAAAYMSTQEILDGTGLSRLFVGIFSDLNKVLEFEKTFLFVCGQQKTVATRLSEFIMKIMSSDVRVMEFRRTDLCEEIYLIMAIQDVIVAGSMETIKNHKATQLLLLNDVYMTSGLNSLFCRFNAKQILTCDRSRATSIHVDQKEFNELSRLWNLPSSSCMERMFLKNIDIPHATVFFKSFSPTQLFMLHLEDLRMEHRHMERIVGSLASAENLRYFSIINLICGTHRTIVNRCTLQMKTFNHKALKSYRIVNLKHASPRVSITEWPLSIGMNNVNLNSVDIIPPCMHSSTLSACDLSKLYLQNITLSHAQLMPLFNKLASSENLTDLELRDIVCSTHKESKTVCSHVLDLCQHHMLTNITLCNLSAGMSGVSSYQRIDMIKRLEVGDVTMTHEQIERLFCALSKADTLSRIQMRELTCSTHKENINNCTLQLNLPQCQGRRIMHLLDLKIGLLEVMFCQDIVNNTRLQIGDITEYRKQMTCLAYGIDSANNLSDTQLVELIFNKATDNKNLSDSLQHYETATVCLIDHKAFLSRICFRRNMDKLQQLLLTTQTMTHEQLECLCEDIASSTNLKDLKFKKLICSTHKDNNNDCNIQLDLSQHRDLGLVQLWNLGIRFKSILFCQNMKRLESVELSNVTMTHEQLERLCENIASNTNLKHLQLKELICSTHKDNTNDCNIQLDVSRNHELVVLLLFNLGISFKNIMFSQNIKRLERVEISNVTMTHEQLECLCENIASNTNLKHLQLKELICSTHKDNTNDCNIQLDVSRNHELVVLLLCNLGISFKNIMFSQNIKRLESVELSNVTMTHEQVESLLSSLTSAAEHLLHVKMRELTCSTCTVHTGPTDTAAIFIWTYLSIATFAFYISGTLVLV